MIRAVILDDETKGSSLLEHKLNSLDESLSVVKIFSNPELALAEIKELEIDVLFLDVETPKLNGFQFLEKLGSFDFEVIFVTAYNEYALATLDFDGHQSVISYPLSVFVYATAKPAPEGFKISTKGEVRLLSWNRPSRTEVNHYILYKDTGEGLEQFDSVDGSLEYNLGKDDAKNYGIRAVYKDASKSVMVRLQ